MALTVLSRYQQSRPVSGDCSPGTSQKLSEETDESSMPVIQDSKTIREDPDNFWPELSPPVKTKDSGNIVPGDAAWGYSQSGSHSPPETSHKASVEVAENSSSTKPTAHTRSYAQAALKAVDSPPLMVFRSNVDVSSPLALNSDTRNPGEGVNLPHIDWTSVQVPSRVVDLPSSSSNDSHLKYLRSPTPVPKDPKQGKLDLTRKKKGKKGHIVDLRNNPRTALPERMDALQLDSATRRDLLLRDDLRLPSSRRLDKVIVDDDGKGTSYYSLDFESSGDSLVIFRQIAFIIGLSCRAMLFSHLCFRLIGFRAFCMLHLLSELIASISFLWVNKSLFVPVFSDVNKHKVELRSTSGWEFALSVCIPYFAPLCMTLLLLVLLKLQTVWFHRG